MTILISLLLGFGLLIYFVGDAVSPSEVGTVFTYAGLAIIGGAFLWRLYHFSQAKSDSSKRVEGWIVATYVGVLLSLGIRYWLHSQGGDADGEDDSLAGILAVGWPALFFISALPLAFTEAVYGFMPLAEAVDERRVRSAAFGGLTIAFALVAVISANYVARARDVREDLSYFRVSAPSEGTRQAVQTLDEPMRVVLLYPTNNDVLARLRPYFEELDRASEHLSVEVKDHALAPELTRKHRVSDNGYIVLIHGEENSERAKTINVGLELVGARNTLKTLDGRFRRSFNQLTTIPRELYLTAGHQERRATGNEGDERGDWISQLDEALRQANITVRTLGVSQGLADEVPDDAPAVAIVGPHAPFLPEEAQALLRYVDGGGRLMVFVDPDVDHGLTPLLNGLGLQMGEGVVASERYYIRRTNTEADRTIVRTSRYTGHPTVTLAMRNASRGIASVFLASGYLENYNGEEKLGGLRVQFPITSTAEFWVDANGNFSQDEGERTGQVNLMAAVTKGGGDREGRAVVVADGDFITDQLIRNPGNGLVLSDILEWLIGQEQIVGDVSTEEDVDLERTQEEDKLYFWGASLLVPLPIAGFGAWVGFRRQRRRRSTAKDPGEGSDGGSGGSKESGSGSKEGAAKVAKKAERDADSPEGEEPPSEEKTQDDEETAQ